MSATVPRVRMEQHVTITSLITHAIARTDSPEKTARSTWIGAQQCRAKIKPHANK